MTNKLILINTDTHVVVPKELTQDMRDQFNDRLPDYEQWKNILEEAPQLTTPPVLRWEDNHLVLFGKKYIAYVHKKYGESVWVNSIEIIDYHTEQEARRAAEKALGLPEIEKV